MVQTLVTFHAHPDDDAIQCGGTMARAKADGHRVVLVVATRGELGEIRAGVLDRRRGARRSPRRRDASRGRDPRRRPRRIPRLRRLRDGGRADERRAGLLRGRRRRGGRARLARLLARRTRRRAHRLRRQRRLRPSRPHPGAPGRRARGRDRRNARGVRGDDEPRPLQAADGRRNRRRWTTSRSKTVRPKPRSTRSASTRR